MISKIWVDEAEELEKAFKSTLEYKNTLQGRVEELDRARLEFLVALGVPKFLSWLAAKLARFCA